MLAVSSAGWTGMGFIEDINSGVMDRMLASPVWRGALNAGTVTYAALTVVIQTVLIVLLALALGADYRGGVGGVLLLIVVGGAARRRRSRRSRTASACSRASARR